MSAAPTNPHDHDVVTPYRRATEPVAPTGSVAIQTGAAVAPATSATATAAEGVRNVLTSGTVRIRRSSLPPHSVKGG